MKRTLAGFCKLRRSTFLPDGFGGEPALVVETIKQLNRLRSRLCFAILREYLLAAFLGLGKFSSGLELLRFFSLAAAAVSSASFALPADNWRSPSDAR